MTLHLSLNENLIYNLYKKNLTFINYESMKSYPELLTLKQHAF